MAKSIDLGKPATALKSCVFKAPSTFARQHWGQPGVHPLHPNKAGHSKQPGSAENSDCWSIHGDEAGLKSNHRFETKCALDS